MNLILRPLGPDDEAAFYAGKAAFAGEDLSWYTFSWSHGMTYAELLARAADEVAGRNLAPGRVAASMLYGFVDGAIVGRVSIRHRLNDYLLYRGGHVGYAVAPPYRRRGYAAEMFRQALPVCRELGLDKLLVTCGDDNEASRRIIEGQGGVLENKVFDAEDNEMIRRYWVPL